MLGMALFVTVALLVGACAAETVSPQTTTVAVEEPSTTATTTTTTTVETTTTTVVETTATVAEGPIDICRSPTVIWKKGETYTASCFALSWSVVAPGDRWRAPSIDESSMLVSWIDSSDFTARVNLALAVGGEKPGDRLESIVSVEGLHQIDSGSSVVAGRNALWVDVEGDPLRSNVRSGCAMDSPGGVYLRGAPANGYPIAPAPVASESFGVGGCDIARIWVLEVDGRTVTILGGTADPDRHAEAVAKIEELFEGMSFDAGGGS